MYALCAVEWCRLVGSSAVVFCAGFVANVGSGAKHSIETRYGSQPREEMEDDGADGADGAIHTGSTSAEAAAEAAAEAVEEWGRVP